MTQREKTPIAHDALLKLLRYEPETGQFIRLVNSSRLGKEGQVAGCKHPGGYWIIGLRGREYKAHRLAWFYMTGAWPAEQIDHINTVRDDNRWANLRECSNASNQRNRRSARRDSSSGLLGVHWHTQRKRWWARLKVNGKDISLGLFDDKHEAHAAYVAAKRIHHDTCSL